jgi:hypothetical protein
VLERWHGATTHTNGDRSPFTPRAR